MIFRTGELEDNENVFLPDVIEKGNFHHPPPGDFKCTFTVRLLLQCGFLFTGVVSFANNFNVSPPSGGVVLMQSQGVPSNDETTKPSDDELLIQIREQLEYYFSKDNISSDKYLCESQN